MNNYYNVHKNNTKINIIIIKTKMNALHHTENT